MLGIPNFVIAVNKMDLVGYDQEVFQIVFARIRAVPGTHRHEELLLPSVDALKGDNVVDRGSHMPWFDGPPLLEYLETVDPADNMIQAPFRMAVQRVVRPDQNFRGYAGRSRPGPFGRRRSCRRTRRAGAQK